LPSPSTPIWPVRIEFAREKRIAAAAELH